MDETLRQKISDVQAEYAPKLMGLPNVIGLGIGYKRIQDETTDTLCLVVMVTQKVPLKDLKVDERVPKALDDVPLDVQETGGRFSAG